MKFVFDSEKLKEFEEEIVERIKNLSLEMEMVDTREWSEKEKKNFLKTHEDIIDIGEVPRAFDEMFLMIKGNIYRGEEVVGYLDNLERERAP
ncbi:MAG: hypothetical protein R6U61_03590 [Thermoplasmata archaeon]